MTSQDILDTLIRDLTKAGFMAKSEARKRVEEYGKALLAEKREKIEKMKINIPDKEKITKLQNKIPMGWGCCGEEMDGYNIALTDVLSLLSE